MSKHTPGPWKIGNNRTVYYDGPGHRIVAECGQSTYREIDQANTRLIAAAPKLLEAARLAVKFIEGMHTEDKDEIFAYRDLLAAISEAEGE